MYSVTCITAYIPYIEGRLCSSSPFRSPILLLDCSENRVPALCCMFASPTGVSTEKRQDPSNGRMSMFSNFVYEGGNVVCLLYYC